LNLEELETSNLRNDIDEDDISMVLGDEDI